MQVPHVPVIDGVGELHFDGEDPSIITDHDEVDFVVPIAGAKVGDLRFGRLRGHAYAQGDQGFEEMPEHGACLRADRSALPIEQGVQGQAQEPCRQSGVGEVVLGCLPRRVIALPVGIQAGTGSASHRLVSTSR